MNANYPSFYTNKGFAIPMMTLHSQKRSLKHHFHQTEMQSVPGCFLQMLSFIVLNTVIENMTETYLLHQLIDYQESLP